MKGLLEKELISHFNSNWTYFGILWIKTAADCCDVKEKIAI